MLEGGDSFGGAVEIKHAAGAPHAVALGCSCAVAKNSLAAEEEEEETETEEEEEVLTMLSTARTVARAPPETLTLAAAIAEIATAASRRAIAAAWAWYFAFTCAAVTCLAVSLSLLKILAVVCRAKLRSPFNSRKFLTIFLSARRRSRMAASRSIQACVIVSHRNVRTSAYIGSSLPNARWH